MAQEILLNNGHSMPLVGLGTWLNPCPQAAVRAALACGYRHIDTAQAYGNEGQIGEALHEVLQQGEIQRQDIFVCTKLSNTNMAPEDVRPSVVDSLTKLQLTYIDLLLIHYPVATKEKLKSFDPSIKIASESVDHLQTWKAMESLVDEGLVRSLGVSNFNQVQIQRLLDGSRIKPANVQIEVHPLLNNDMLVKYCVDRGVSVTAFCPLAHPAAMGRPAGQINLLEEEAVITIARKYNITPAQVLLRYPIQRGLAVIPKSTSPEHIKENLQVFDFELSEEDLAVLKQYESGWRVFSGGMFSEAEEYPWKI